ncbi:MAG: phage tail protein [Clostridia bacterium]|nr:phage tail protein [Clostridia bacterium]
MLKLHEYNEEKFDGGCVAYLGDAIEVKVEKKINEIESVYFDYPYTDEKAGMIKENMIVSCEGQGYVILKNSRNTKGKDIKSVTASDLFSTYGKMKFIPNIPDMIGKKPSVIFNKILEGSCFTAFTEDELNELGMTWIDNDGYEDKEYLIDFFSMDKTNVWDATKTLIENCGKGELYRDNFKVAIVKRLGTDNGVRLTLEKNMEDMNIMHDFEGVITRLYPFGADDMHIGSVNGGVQYIDSPNIEKYGIREGYRDYSDYTDPKKIKAHAEWEFSPDNEDRIDIPKIIITGGFIDLAKLPEYEATEKVDIGDTVHVYDNDHNVYHQRIVAITTYPYEPKMPTIQIGHIQNDFFSILWNLCQRRKELEKVQTTNKQVTTRKIAGTVNTDRNEVQSDNELLKIVGDLLTISDGDNIRIRLGNYNGEFVFIIYDKNNNQAVYLNEKGEAVFTGSIDTKQDATIGSRLNLQTTDFVGDTREPAISFKDKSGNILAEISVTNDGCMRLVPIVEGGMILVGNTEIANKDDIADLQGQIEDLRIEIAKLQ